MPQRLGTVSLRRWPSSGQGSVPTENHVSPPGFLDVSGLSLLDSSNASVWPGLPSSIEMTPPAVSASGLEDVCSSSGSHERGGEGLAPLRGDPGLWRRRP